MGKFRERFFEGYRLETVPDNSKKGSHMRLEYVGEKYDFAPGTSIKRRKLECAALFAVSAAANIAAQLMNAVGAAVPLVSMPAILSLVPLIFFLIGLLHFLLLKGAWEIRDYYAGYRRMRISGMCYLVFLGIWLAIETVFIMLNPFLLTEELPYLAVIAMSFSAQLCQTVLIVQAPAVVVEGPKIR